MYKRSLVFIKPLSALAQTDRDVHFTKEEKRVSHYSQFAFITSIEWPSIYGECRRQTNESFASKTTATFVYHRHI